MTTTRIGINVRVCGLAAALGLAGATQALPRVAGSYFLLCAIAALASVPQPARRVSRILPVVEGALVGVTLGITGTVNQPLGMYLMVPVLLAGLVGGPRTASAAFLAELSAIAAVPIVQLDPELLSISLREMLPWLLTAIGIGLLGSWIRRLSGARPDEDHERYVAAYRLLAQLRVVSRRLSSGLDPVVLSTTLLDDCLARVPDGRGAVLVPTDGGLFVSLAQRLDGMSGVMVNDPLVLQCWTTVQTASRAAVPDRFAEESPYRTIERDVDGAAQQTRYALPLRVGPRIVGVLALDVARQLDPSLLKQLQTLLDDRALPIDTALLFDEVRTLATVEERHRLAREIHDGVAQEIASLGYLVDDLATSADDTGRAVRLAQVRAELTRIVNDLRLSIFDLRSQVSRTTGLGAVVGDYLREVGSRSGTAVHLSLDEAPDRLRIEVEEELLRILQEAVTNARKHSGAHNLWVTCRVRPPTADLVVEDDGSGLPANVQADGFGLSVMRERADRIGATVTITDRSGGGTRVCISLHPSSLAGASGQGQQVVTWPLQRLARPLPQAALHG